MFYFDYVAGKKVLKSDLLENLEHFFTTRDCCLFSKTEDMSQNRRAVEEYLGVKMATNQPVHGIRISKIFNNKYFYEESDGLLIEKSGAAYMNFGDCTPIIFQCKDVAVISHAGWRGTAQGMVKNTVKLLTGDYGFKPEDIKAVIGPAICLNCYEVGKDVYDALVLTVSNKESGFSCINGRYFVGLKEINRQQLQECGVRQIDVCPYCTACGEKLFYSYRHENHTGYRHSVVVKM